MAIIKNKWVVMKKKVKGCAKNIVYTNRKSFYAFYGKQARSDFITSNKK